MIKTFFILASSSPRRIEFLKNLGLNFKQVTSLVKEDSNSNLSPEKYVLKNAENKARFVEKNYISNLIAGFDTVVEIDRKILGKPENFENAFNMLKLLSNKTHNVLTGYVLINNQKNFLIKKVVKTEVVFKKLDDKEIRWYLKGKEPYDKAGAYAIQGIGSFMVKKINGSYTNVVGLPVAEFLEDLKYYENCFANFK